jgi:hypothetical protein
MRVFISYASEDKRIAEALAHSLRGRRHQVFFDVTDIAAASNYEEQIEEAIRRSHIFVFLISPDSVKPGNFTLTELAFAQRKWPHAANHVVSVVIRPTPPEEIPPYLSAVSILKPEGNPVTEASAAVNRLASRGYFRGSGIRIAAALLLCLLLVTGLLYADDKSNFVGMYRVSIGPNGGCENPNRGVTGKPGSKPSALAVIKPLGAGRFAAVNECGMEGKLEVGAIDTQLFGQYAKVSWGRFPELIPQDGNRWAKVDRGFWNRLLESICYWTTGLVCVDLDEKTVHKLP